MNYNHFIRAAENIDVTKIYIITNVFCSWWWDIIRRLSLTHHFNGNDTILMRLSTLAARSRHFESLHCSRWSKFHQNDNTLFQWLKLEKDDIFNCILLNENHYILTDISMTFVSEDLTNNKWALIQVNHYRKVSNMRHTLVGNKIVDHWDVLGAAPIGAARTTSSFSTEHVASMDWAKITANETRNVYVWALGALYIRELRVFEQMMM